MGALKSLGQLKSEALITINLYLIKNEGGLHTIRYLLPNLKGQLHKLAALLPW